MVTCQKVIDDFLMKYVAGELSLGERLKFNAHLLFCRACQHYVRSYKETIALSKSAFDDPDAPPPPDVPEELIRAILASRDSR